MPAAIVGIYKVVACVMLDRVIEWRDQSTGLDIVAYMGGLSEEDMAGDVTYKTTSGDPFTMERAFILQHFFNHHAHHRSQTHDLLSQTSIEPPVLDLLYYVRG